MSAEELGTAVIKAAVDATGIKTGIGEGVGAFDDLAKGAKNAGAKVEKSLKDIAAEGEQTSTKTSQAARSFIASLERQALAAGKTRSEYLALRAAQLGVSDQAATYIAKQSRRPAKLACRLQRPPQRCATCRRSSPTSSRRWRADKARCW